VPRPADVVIRFKAFEWDAKLTKARGDGKPTPPGTNHRNAARAWPTAVA
jgi:hypothetical protein